MIGEKKMEMNTVFCDESNAPICNGWLPEGYKPFCNHEPDRENMAENPAIIWVGGRNAEGKELFMRLFRKYRYSRKEQEPQNPFMEYDEYLDTNALELMKTNNIRLLRRFCLTDEEMDKLRNRLIKNRDSIRNAYKNMSEIEEIIQGIYGGSGAKLYEADIDGKKIYLVLTATIYGSEYGLFSARSYEMDRQNRETMRSIQSMSAGNAGFFGGGMFYQPQQPKIPEPLPPVPQFDCDPNTPVGKHRTDYLLSATMIWEIHNFAGFITPVKPDEDEIREFLCFTRSVEIHPEMRRMLEQVQSQAIMNQIQTNQMIANGFQQATRVQQQCFDKSFAAMKSLSDMNYQMTEHRMAVDNAHFDHMSRMQHEAIMGVNTYQRPDGSTVEFSTMADRVFEKNNDPSLTVGFEGSGPDTVPYGWTELTKLK